MCAQNLIPFSYPSRPFCTSLQPPPSCLGFVQQAKIVDRAQCRRMLRSQRLLVTLATPARIYYPPPSSSCRGPRTEIIDRIIASTFVPRTFPSLAAPARTLPLPPPPPSCVFVQITEIVDRVQCRSSEGNGLMVGGGWRLRWLPL